MTNPSPLEKQLFHLNLSKGVNERDRPETADPQTLLTQVQNLVQDQGGAWVKRPGTVTVGASLGNAVQKSMRLRDGLGVITADAKLYQYSEGGSVFKASGRVSEASLTSDLVASSGPTVAGDVRSTTSTDKYHVVVSNAGIGISNSIPVLLITVYDRASGAVIAQYDAGRLISSTADAFDAEVIFTDDTHLHIYVLTTTWKGIVMTTSAWPTSFTAGVSSASASGATSGDAVDICTYAGRSYLLTAPTVSNRYVITMSNAQAITDAAVLADTKSIYVQAMQAAGRGIELWCMSINLAQRFNATTLASLAASTSNGAFAFGNHTSFCIDTDATFWVATEFTDTLGATSPTSTRFHRSGTPGSPLLAAAHATLVGWALAGSPFTLNTDDTSITNATYVHLYKFGTQGTATPHVLVSMGIADNTLCSASYLPYTVDHWYTSARLVAVLEPSFADYARKALRRAHPSFQSGGIVTKCCLFIPLLTTARGIGFAITEVRVDRESVSKCNDTEILGYSNYMSGAVQSVMAGNRPHEVGFVDAPLVSAQDSGVAGVITGAFKYIAVYRGVDESGAVAWSRTSLPASLTVTAKKATVTIGPACVTDRDLQYGYDPFTATVDLCPCTSAVEVYRTLVGGTQYYLVGGTQSGLTQVVQMTGAAPSKWSLTDNMTDAVLATQPQLFRQPGTPNAAVDRYTAPGGHILCQHKDRLFTVDTYGSRVCYSSFFVDGETAWYNPAFSFFVHGGSGPITGMASMDGRLFIFKRDSIFIVDGDGPAEGGVTGNEYSPPQRLATEHGCVDHRTIVVTSEGLMYRSGRGIEMLSRSLQVKFIGQNVQTTVDAYQNNYGACMDNDGRFHILVASDEIDEDRNRTVRELVYDFTSDCWSIMVYAAAQQFRDVCVAQLSGVEEVCYADMQYRVYKEDSAAWLDNGAYVPMVVETGWIRTGQQTRARFSRLLALLKANAGCNHKMVLSVAFNFVDTYTQTATWEPVMLNTLAIEELELQLVRPEVMAVRFKLSDAAPSDTVTYPIGTGRGPDVLGITAEIAPKVGAPKGPAGQKA